MAAMLYVVVVVGRTRLGTILLAMLTMRRELVRVAWFSLSAHACGSVAIVMAFRLVAHSVAGAAL